MNWNLSMTERVNKLNITMHKDHVSQAFNWYLRQYAYVTDEEHFQINSIKFLKDDQVEIDGIIENT